MNIPDDLVERVARARYDTIHDNDGMPWNDQHPTIRRLFTEMSRVWLQAAADAGLLTCVYRAHFDGTPLGLYATRAAAREHCLADAKDHGDDVSGAQWWPQDDEDPEGSEECLVVQDPAGGDQLTDYSVMPLTVATAYDPTLEG